MFVPFQKKKNKKKGRVRVLSSGKKKYKERKETRKR